MIEWEKDENGHWTLIFENGDEKVRFLTPKQKETLEEIFQRLDNKN